MTDHIFITCPVTSQPAKTGFRAAKGTNISHLKHVQLQYCPACGKSHVWGGDMGFWDNTAPPDTSLWEQMRRIWTRPKRRVL